MSQYPPRDHFETNSQYMRGPNASSDRSYRPRNCQPRRGRSLKRLVLFLVLAMVIVGVVIGYRMYDDVMRVQRDNTFYPGIYINNVPLFGATPQQAYDYLLSNAKARVADWRVTLLYGDMKWELTPDLLGMNGTIENSVRDEVNNAFLIGRNGDSFMERYQIISALKKNPYYAYTSDEQATTSWMDTLVAEIETAVYVEPKDATWAFDSGRRNPVVITSEENGQRLNVNELKEQLAAMVENMEAGTIQIQTESISPGIFADALKDKVTLLADYSSPISTSSPENRIMNIERGCEAFNGKVIQPGEKVSFNNWVGKRTPENGFYEALEIANGEYRTGYGGGICQVSTALYNAVIQANLQVDSRRNHGLQVDYVDMGADATVYDDRIDFVFTNNTGEPLYVLSRVESVNGGKRKQCVFQFYGRPDPNGYSYSLKHLLLEEIPIPDANIVKDRKQKYVTFTDEEYVESKGAKGYKVETFLVVKDSQGTIISETSLYVDTYKPQVPKVYVGTQTRK